MSSSSDSSSSSSSSDDEAEARQRAIFARIAVTGASIGLAAEQSAKQSAKRASSRHKKRPEDAEPGEAPLDQPLQAYQREAARLLEKRLDSCFDFAERSDVAGDSSRGAENAAEDEPALCLYSGRVRRASRPARPPPPLRALPPSECRRLARPRRRCSSSSDSDKARAACRTALVGCTELCHLQRERRCAEVAVDGVHVQAGAEKAVLRAAVLFAQQKAQPSDENDAVFMPQPSGPEETALAAAERRKARRRAKKLAAKLQAGDGDTQEADASGGGGGGEGGRVGGVGDGAPEQEQQPTRDKPQLSQRQKKRLKQALMPAD